MKKILIELFSFILLSIYFVSVMSFASYEELEDKVIYEINKDVENIISIPLEYEIIKENNEAMFKIGNHTFNMTQMDHLAFACEYGLKTDIKHEDICYIFSALIWQESGAGLKTSGGKGHYAYGVFQNYLPTVRSRLKQKGLNYTDKEIISMLSEKEISAAFAEEELMDWLKHRNGDMFKALASYNAGWKWEKGRGYANAIMAKVKLLKKEATFLTKG